MSGIGVKDELNMLTFSFNYPYKTLIKNKNISSLKLTFLLYIHNLLCLSIHMALKGREYYSMNEQSSPSQEGKLFIRS